MAQGDDEVDERQNDATEGKLYSRLYASAIFALVISALTWAVVVVLASERIIESWIPIARWVWLISTVIGIAAAVAMMARGRRNRRRRSPTTSAKQYGLGRNIMATILAWPFVAAPLGATGIGVIYLAIAHPDPGLAPVPLIVGVVAVVLSVPAMLLADRPAESDLESG